MDKVSMQFSLNQAVLNTAISAALPSLLKELEFDYTSGRAPKGLTAQVTVTEAMIRKAVEQYARRTVNASFTHFGIEFQATRGEDGIVANITASNEPIQPDEPKADAPRAAKAADPAPVASDPEPAAVTEPEVEVAPAAEAVEAQAGEDAPFEADEPAADEAVDAPAEEAVVSEPASTTTAAPAPTRSKLFATLSRPSNEPTE
jgi:hypothetical protein